jgi:CheY-like chemotaxis protein
MPRGPGLATRRLRTVCEARTELMALALDRFVTDANPALEQQLLDITQAELKSEIPTHRATDDRHRKVMTVEKRIWILYQAIVLDYLRNVTVPLKDHGFEIERVVSGHDGLLRVIAGEFDAVVLDRMLPDIDGAVRTVDLAQYRQAHAGADSERARGGRRARAGIARWWRPTA